MDDLVERVLALKINGTTPLPEGVELDQLWDVPVGTLWLQPAAEHGNCDFSECTKPESVACPTCENTSELHLVGRWTEPATCHCPLCGNAWSLNPRQPQWEVELMQQAISAALLAHGTPR
ncbi:hypothetical protein [Streptomyces sp. NPDC101455]|uniref:hypothetical protein n=1 Tax=Streptomyces sp. NPDC101455 TaxID=3366142 RepID=UPI00381A23DA